MQVGPAAAESMHGAVRARPCMCSPRLQWRAPLAGKIYLSAYTAGPNAHLLRRPRVSLAYAVLLQAEQSGADLMFGRHYCLLDRDAVKRPQMALKGAISFPVALTNPLFLS